MATKPGPSPGYTNQMSLHGSCVDVTIGTWVKASAFRKPAVTVTVSPPGLRF